MKIYHKFLLILFLKSFLKVFIIFFAIIFITNIFEQINFFQNTKISFFYPLLLAMLNSPSIIFEILPFIFLISTQIFFIYLIDNNELSIFKYLGLDNFKIIKIISFFSFICGIFSIMIFYNFSSILKNNYLSIKNSYTNDDKYLAVITDNGLWIKDEIDQKINIINSSKMEGQYLMDVLITQLDMKHNHIRTIEGKKVEISTHNWKIINPIITEKNITYNYDFLKFQSSFDLKKINSLFSNLSSLTIFELYKLRNNYKKLNYSVTAIDSHLLKIFSYPIYLTLITLLSSVIMFNIGYQKNSIYKIILGILLSVLIYYVNFFFNVLGTSEKIPLVLSIWFPLIILLIINFTSMVRINEK